MIRARIGLPVALLGCAGCAHLFGPQPATGWLELLRVHWGPAGGEHFGSALCDIGDWSGDGRSDYAIGAPAEVQIVSGATGGTLRRLEAPPGASGFGGALCAHPDLDGDGRTDLAVGVLGRFPEEAWAVEIRSSKDDRVLRTLHPPGNGRALAFLPSPKDPSDSLLLAASLVTPKNGDSSANVVAFRCGDGTIAYRFEDPEKRLAPDVARCGDVDGDGFPDFAVPGSRRSVFVVSGKSGQLVRVLQSSIQGRVLPTDDALDLDRDGTPDVALAEIVQDTMTLDGGVEILSGRDGRRLWSTRCPAADGTFLRVGGRTALAVVGPGSFALFDLLADLPVCRLKMSTSDCPNLTWIGDVNGDGKDDLAVTDERAHGFVGIVSRRTLEEMLRG